jgi:hypothetical protein
MVNRERTHGETQGTEHGRLSSPPNQWPTPLVRTRQRAGLRPDETRHRHLAGSEPKHETDHNQGTGCSVSGEDHLPLVNVNEVFTRLFGASRTFGSTFSRLCTPLWVHRTRAAVSRDPSPRPLDYRDSVSPALDFRSRGQLGDGPATQPPAWDPLRPFGNPAPIGVGTNRGGVEELMPLADHQVARSLVELLQPVLSGTP